MMIQNRLNESRTTGSANQANRNHQLLNQDFGLLGWNGASEGKPEISHPFLCPGDLSHSRDLILQFHDSSDLRLALVAL